MPDLKKMLTLEALSEALPSWLKRSTKPEYNADEIDSTLTTNQFVTASDKENWNAKGTYSKPSGGIPKSDLSSIVQTSLEKADSALQNETDPTVPSWAKQTNKPSYTQDEVADGSTYKRVSQSEKDAWSGKQNALTTVQMSAVNSGITAAGVIQIGTNQANVLYALNRTGKNIINIQEPDMITAPNIAYSFGDNGAVSFTVTNQTWTRYNIAQIPVKPNTQYKLVIYADALSSLPAFNVYPRNKDASGANLIDGVQIPSTGVFVNDFTTISDTMWLGIYPNNSSTAATGTATIRVMICEKTLYDISSEYTWGKPNYDLTRLEAEDRAALAEEIDAGAKNKFNPANIAELRNLATNGSDYAYVSTSTDTRTQCNFCVFSWNGSTKIDQLTKVDVTANGKIALIFTKTAGYNKISFGHSGQTKDLMIFYNVSDLVNGQTYVLSVNITQFNPSVTNFAFSDVMICTKAAFDVSQKFVPYRPNYDAVSEAAMSAAFTHKTIQNADLNSINKNYYGLYQNATNMPSGTSGFAFVRTTWFDSQAAMQELTLLAATSNSYVRVKYGNAWTAWKQVTNA